MNIGDKIPEILGVDQDGNIIRSSDYKGRKIVLYSYPKANTSGCTAEACSLQDHIEEFDALGYSIIGVSKDKKELQKKFAEAHAAGDIHIHDMDFVAMGTTTCMQIDLNKLFKKVIFGMKTNI